MSRWVKVFAPATVANVGPGFDVLGFALDEPGDHVEVRKRSGNAVEITEITGDNGLLPRDLLRNTAGIGVVETLRLLDIDGGVEVRLHKNMPLGSGLGSSGASSVAASYAVNVLFGTRLSKNDLIPPCMKGEEIACGTPHADNVAPAMLGGFVLVRSYEPLDIIQLPSPKALVAVVVTPQYEVKTRDARAALPKQVALRDAVSNWGNVSAIIAALYQNDVKLLGRALDDRIIEPVRAPLIPGYYDVKKAALESGAYGVSISGAGPSVFAITDDRGKGREIGKSMQEAFQKNALKSTLFLSGINGTGARVV